MKRVILGAVALLCLASCSYRVYPVDALVDNYKLAMTTPEEVAARENVAVFLSEQEVKSPYKLIAFVENPSPIAKDFLKKAVLKADELGGNAVIVQSARSFKVVELPGRPARKAAAAPTQSRPRPEPRVSPSPKQKAPVKESRAESGNIIDKVKGAPIFQKDESKAEARAEARAAREEAARTRAAEAEAARAKAAAERAAKAEADRVARAEAEAARAKAAADKAAKAEADKAAKAAAAADQYAREEAARAEAEAAKARAAAEKAAAEKAAAAKAAAEKAAAAPKAAPAVKSPVFDDSTLQWFTSGYVYRAKEEEQLEIIDAMNYEIRENLKVCQTLAEADFIANKINQLEKYNNSLPIPSGTQASKIKGYRNMLKKLSSKFSTEQPAAAGAVQSVKDFFQNLGNK